MCFFFGCMHLSSYDSECQGMLSSFFKHFPQCTLQGLNFLEEFFSSHVLLSHPTVFFVLGLGAKSTVIELQQTMMKILGLLPLSVMENST